MKPREDIIEKVRKLLALAANTGATPGEAAAAAHHAELLMRKFNIDHADAIIDELKNDEDALEMDVIKEEGDVWRNYPGWMSSLSVYVGELMGCECRLVRDYAMVNNKKTAISRLSFFGYKADVKVARYTYLFLVAEINRLTEEYYTKSKPEHYFSSPRLVKSSFRQGCASEVISMINKMIAERTKAEEAEKAKHTPTSTSTALVVVAKREAIEAKFGKFSYAKSSAKEVDGAAYRSGREAGKGIKIHQGIERGSPAAKVFLS